MGRAEGTAPQPHHKKEPKSDPHEKRMGAGESGETSKPTQDGFPGTAQKRQVHHWGSDGLGMLLGVARANGSGWGFRMVRGKRGVCDFLERWEQRGGNGQATKKNLEGFHNKKRKHACKNPGKSLVRKAKETGMGEGRADAVGGGGMIKREAATKRK